MDETRTEALARLDHAHVWHPFTPMRQWRAEQPVVIERGEGDWLIDTRGRRYIDGVSSLWCNVHGHRVPEIDAAIRDQLGRVAHSTMLGLANVPATELAARLCAIAPGPPGRLNKVFYSDAGATATEVALKMAVGYWYHNGQPERHTFIALEGAYHGDTTGSMSVGYSDVFHRPFRRMVFHAQFVPAPALCGIPARRDTGGAPPTTPRTWPLEDNRRCAAAGEAALGALATALREHGERVAGIVIEPLVQGAAGMAMQPPGYLAGVAALAREHGTLLIADEVATGFGRTGRMFACEHEGVAPDILCLGKGLTGGYLPVAATLCTDAIEEAFTGEPHEHRTLYHGHTFTGNPLGCAAALASLDLFERHDLLAAVRRKAERLARLLDPLRDAGDFPHVADVRQCGLMVGIELNPSGAPAEQAAPVYGGGASGGDFGESPADTAVSAPPRRIAYDACQLARSRGVLIRPLGNTIILMPPLAIRDENLDHLARATIQSIRECGP